MTKFTFLTLALLAGVSLNALRAEAQAELPPGEQPQTLVPDEADRPAFAEIDADGDGAVTREELRIFGTLRGRARFAGIDTDGDGLASRDELLAHDATQAGARVDRSIARLDVDGDGLLSAEEAAARPAGPRAGRPEARVDDRRVQAGRAGPRDRGDRDPDGGHHGGHHGSHHGDDRAGHVGGRHPDRRGDARDDAPRDRRGNAGGPAMFERADADGNGSLSVEEWDAAGRRGRN